MYNKLNDDQLYTIAKKRVDEKKDFFFHILIYISINIILWIITINESANVVLQLAVTVGWGIGILNQGATVFYNGKFNNIEKEFIKLKRDFTEEEEE